MAIELVSTGGRYDLRLSAPESKVGPLHAARLTRAEAVAAMREAGVHPQDLWDAVAEAEAAAAAAPPARRRRTRAAGATG